MSNKLYTLICVAIASMIMLMSSGAILSTEVFGKVISAAVGIPLIVLSACISLVSWVCLIIIYLNWVFPQD